MAPPRLADEQIVAGPDWPDAQDAQGRWLSVQTPAGEYSVAAVLAKLPTEQWPDVLVCLVDSSRRNLPRHTAAFRGPRVLLVADTHHLEAPVATMVRYAVAEKFDRVVLLYDRHHAVFFRSAGVKPLFWFPGLTFPHADSVWMSTARASAVRPQIAFAGQNGRHHPRRARLLAALQRDGVPLEARLVPQEAVLPFYAGSAVGFNASLNGDLNLRVFEIMASGALLLTDQLAPSAGLAHLAELGCAFETYCDERSLVERARHGLAHPAEARTRAAKTQAWMRANFHERSRQTMFAALVTAGRAPELFPLENEPVVRVAFRSAADWLKQTGVYEAVQEMHRVQEQVRVAWVGEGPSAFRESCRTLPRLHEVTASDACDLWVGPGDAEPPSSLAARRAWCHDAVPTERIDLIARWAQAGFSYHGGVLAFFQATPESAALLETADAHLRHGRHEFAAATIQGVLAREPAQVPALELAGRLALATQDSDLARQVRDALQNFVECEPAANRMATALRVLAGEPSGAEPELAATRVAFAGKRWAEAAKHALAAAKADPLRLEPYVWLTDALLALGRHEEAQKPAVTARAAAPWDASGWRRCAVISRRLGRAPEALNDLLHATFLAPDCVATHVALAETAAELRLPGVVRSALAAVRRAEPGHPALTTLAAAACDDATLPEVDLLLLHAEPCRLHGTGVLLQRFFAGTAGLLTVRSHSLYQGKCDLAGMHLVLEMAGLSLAEEERRLRLLLSGRRIRRILCVPFYAADFRRAVLAKEITGAKLAVYVMDDQTLHQGNVSPALAQRCFGAADLRLVISPEMQRGYQERFGGRFDVLPPIVTSTAECVPNHWQPRASGGRVKAALVGNIWSANQFARLRGITRELGLDVDWFGNAAVAWLPRDPASYAPDGIHARGFLPESELARRLANYPFVIVPSGMLDGTEDNEWLTRLSLPSRMVFIVAQTLTPMLVLGHASTAAAGWVERHGLGAVAPYESTAAREAIARLLDPRARAAMIAQARRVADAHTMPAAGEWIWNSLAAGAALPCGLDNLETSTLAGSNSVACPLVA